MKLNEIFGFVRNLGIANFVRNYPGSVSYQLIATGFWSSIRNFIAGVADVLVKEPRRKSRLQ